MSMRRIRNAWYFARSFFRTNWTIGDYPVRVWEQPPSDDDEDTAREGGPQFLAMIEGTLILGSGDTPQAARRNLADVLEQRRATQRLPRPGTRAPIVFASTTKVNAHGTLRDEFLERVLHMGANIFVSDESTLSNFPDGDDEYKRRIMLLYRIDVDTLSDDRLVTILDAIAKR
jgi:hypothetical protein